MYKDNYTTLIFNIKFTEKLKIRNKTKINNLTRESRKFRT